MKQKTDTLFDLVVIQNKKIKETIMTAKPIGLIKWKKRQLESTSHRLQKLLKVPNISGISQLQSFNQIIIR